MSKLALLAVSLLLAGLVLGVAPAVHAQAVSDEDRAAAKERFARGVERMEAEDWAGAVVELERAYQIAPYPVILFNLGIAYEKLDRPLEAVEAMTKVVDDPGNLKPERIETAKKTITEQKKRIGRLALEIEPAGADVRLDGIDIGKSPIDKVTSLRAGTHYLEVLKAGFAPLRREVVVKGQEELRVKVVLETTELAFAQLWIKSPLPAAEIWLDGQRIGVTPLAQSVPVLPGNHTVELRRPGYQTATKSLDLGPGATGEVKLDPEPDESAVAREGGLLLLASDAPEDLVIEIDGRRRGVYTGAIALAVGTHEVRVERAGFLPITLQVWIVKGDRITREVVMDPTPETVAAHNGDVALFRGLGWTFTALGALALGGGVGFTVYNENRISDLDAAFQPKLASDQPCDSRSVNYQEQACIEEATAIDNARGRRPISYALFIGGGVSLVTGVILLIAGPDADEFLPDTEGEVDELAVVPALAPLPGGGLIGVTGRF
jgi:hypothetical protein